MLNHLVLYLHTARHFRPSQILARLSLYAKRKTLHRHPAFLARRYGRVDGKAIVASHGLLPYDRKFLKEALHGSSLQERIEASLADLSANRFDFLNRAVSFGEQISWNPAGESRLWRYNLHYFDYLWSLVQADALLETEEPYRCFRRLVEDWITHNPIAQGVGWHAYPIALRVVNWIYAAVVLHRPLVEDGPFRSRFLSSLYSQCRFLADHLEGDSRGNHLLKDGKALLIAGLFFEGEEPKSWFQKGAGIVRQALDEQILPDGGHYERSPMYHAVVLQDYLEIASLYRHRGLALPSGVRDKLNAMVNFFRECRHPDGEMPLFGDAAFGIAGKAEDLLPVAAVVLNTSRYRCRDDRFGPYASFFLGKAGARVFLDLSPSGASVTSTPICFPQSGCYILGDGRGTSVIVDGGEIGPDEVPAHGHCNIFGYELSVNGRRVITDSGVETYEPGPRRDYYRSTRAHNVLSVEGKEQSETWGAFRVARRARVKNIRHHFGREMAWFEGVHDGYSRLFPGLLHRRLIVHVFGAFFLVTDHVWGAQEKCRLESFIHLHPDVVLWEGSLLRSEEGEALLQLLTFGFDERNLTRASENPIQGWYAPEFGIRAPRETLVLSHHASPPHSCGYVLLRPDVGPARVSIEGESGVESYRISTKERIYRMRRTREGIQLLS